MSKETNQILVEKDLSKIINRKDKKEFDQATKHRKNRKSRNMGEVIANNMAKLLEKTSSVSSPGKREETVMPTALENTATIQHMHNLTEHAVAGPHSEMIDISSSGNSHSLSSQANFPTANDIGFAANTLLAIAIVLKMFGVEKFKDFALPSAPVKIQFDHELPSNQWNIDGFRKLLHESPQAQIVAHYINQKIKEDNIKEWSHDDIVRFVNSPKFDKFAKIAEEVALTARSATKAAFGIKKNLFRKIKKQTYRKTKKQTYRKSR